MTLKPDGYALILAYEDPRDGARLSQVVSPNLPNKALANKVAYAAARDWRNGRGSLADYWRRLNGSERHSGFTAITAGVEIPNGRAFLLKAANRPFGRIYVQQNFKEVN